MKRLLAGIVSFGVAASAVQAQANDFETWLNSFRAEASAAGISASVMDEAFDGVTLNQRVFELNDNQPEFTRAIWDYLDTAVSERKVADGRAALADNRIALSLIESAYGVDAETIVAIWGLESAYGKILGDYDAIQALATLGFEGRRTAYGRSQLIGALKIIQNGYAGRDELKGSWAGAMGHTQFIPTTYLAYAIDHDGDGKRNIWSDLGDVFASTANYLSVSGYANDAGWGLESANADDVRFFCRRDVREKADCRMGLPWGRGRARRFAQRLRPEFARAAYYASGRSWTGLFGFRKFRGDPEI